MKHFCLFILLLFLSGCMQDHVEPSTDPTIALIGIYPLNYLDLRNNAAPFQLPTEFLSGTIEVKKHSSNRVQLTLTFINSNTTTVFVTSIGDFALDPIPNQSNQYTLSRIDNANFGTISPNDIKINHFDQSLSGSVYDSEFRGKR